MHIFIKVPVSFHRTYLVHPYYSAFVAVPIFNQIHTPLAFLPWLPGTALTYRLLQQLYSETLFWFPGCPWCCSVYIYSLLIGIPAHETLSCLFVFCFIVFYFVFLRRAFAWLPTITADGAKGINFLYPIIAPKSLQLLGGLPVILSAFNSYYGRLLPPPSFLPSLISLPKIPPWCVIFRVFLVPQAMQRRFPWICHERAVISGTPNFLPLSSKMIPTMLFPPPFPTWSELGLDNGEDILRISSK